MTEEILMVEVTPSSCRGSEGGGTAWRSGAPPCGTAATRLTPEDEEHPAEVLERHHQDRVGQRHPRVDAAHDARLHRRRCRVYHLVCFVIGNRRTCDIARASRSRDDDGASVLEQSSRAGDLFIWVLNSIYHITDISYLVPSEYTADLQ